MLLNHKQVSVYYILFFMPAEERFTGSLPEPFESKRAAIRNKMHRLAQEPATQERDQALERLRKKESKIEKQGCGRLFLDRLDQMVANLPPEDEPWLDQAKEEQLRDSHQLGIDPAEASQSDYWVEIADALYQKELLEKLFSKPAKKFSKGTTKKLNEGLRDFRDFVSRFDHHFSNSTLDAQVARLTDLVNQKKQEIASYRREQSSSVLQEEGASYSQENQPSERHHVVSDLENVRVGCKAQYTSNQVQVSVGPTLSWGGNKSSIQFGIDVNFNPSSTHRGCRAEVSVSGRKGHVEVGAESSISNSGIEHSCTAQMHTFSNFSAGLRVPSKSFKQMLHPVTAVDNGQLFFGGTLKRGRLKTNVRLGVLPVKKLKNFISSDADESRFESSPFYFEERDEADLSSKQPNQDLELVFKQDKLETTSSLREVQQDSNEQQETLEQEKRETTNERNHTQQAYMVAPEVPAQLTSASRGLGSSYYFFEWFPLSVLLGLRFLIYIFELFDKFINKDKNKDKDKDKNKDL